MRAKSMLVVKTGGLIPGTADGSRPSAVITDFSRIGIVQKGELKDGTDTTCLIFAGNINFI